MSQIGNWLTQENIILLYLLVSSVEEFFFCLLKKFYFILLCNTVLVFPYINMNPPRVYMSCKSLLKFTTSKSDNAYLHFTHGENNVQIR